MLDKGERVEYFAAGELDGVGAANEGAAVDEDEDGELFPGPGESSAGNGKCKIEAGEFVGGGFPKVGIGVRERGLPVWPVGLVWVWTCCTRSRQVKRRYSQGKSSVH